MKKFAVSFSAFFFFASCAFAVEYSDTHRFTQGVSKIVAAPFHVPMEIFQKTISEPPIVGTLHGAVSGVAQTVSGIIGGTFDMFGAAAPYAKYAFPFFLFALKCSCSALNFMLMCFFRTNYFV